MHLGRMVENECLKGYISTARAIDTSIAFATGFRQNRAGCTLPLCKVDLLYRSEKAALGYRRSRLLNGRHSQRTNRWIRSYW